MAFWQQDVPDTAWSGHDEDPIPVLLGRWGWSAFLYRWFAVRPLDGKTRSNATWKREPTLFWTKTKGNIERGEDETDSEWRDRLRAVAPFPARWHMMPRWKQAAYSRLVPTAYVATLPLSWVIGGWRGVGAWLSFHWHHVIVPVFHFLWWLVTLW